MTKLSKMGLNKFALTAFTMTCFTVVTLAMSPATTIAGSKHDKHNNHGDMSGHHAGQDEHPDMPHFDMKNPRHAVAGILSGGQPSKNDLEKVAEHGYMNVLNLRAEGEFSEFDEAQTAAELGLNYISLPIASLADLSKENVQKFDDILNSVDGRTLVHCGSGNRVGALVALRAYQIQGMSKEDALALGTAAGMTSLSEAVEGIIEGE